MRCRGNEEKWLLEMIVRFTLLKEYVLNMVNYLKFSFSATFLKVHARALEIRMMEMYFLSRTRVASKPRRAKGASEWL